MIKENEEKVQSLAMRKAAEKRDLILTILNSTATKREARYYLNKYPLLEDNDIYKNRNREIAGSNTKYDKYIRNLLDKQNFGSLGSDISAISGAGEEMHLTDTLRVMLLRIRHITAIKSSILQGIGDTLARCMKLGVSPIIILESPSESDDNDSSSSSSISLAVNLVNEQCNKMIRFLESNCNVKLRSIQGLFQRNSSNEEKLTFPGLLMVPLLQGMVPVLTPWVIDMETSTQHLVTSYDMLRYTTHSLFELDRRFKGMQHPGDDDSDFVTLEKFVFLDDVGGIPSLERYQSSHVLINLMQEYPAVKYELDECNLTSKERYSHIQNLDQMNNLLTMTPKATGIITTPSIAALHTFGRKNTNPIIHNILTDRPTISSSLPVDLKKAPLLNTTIMKKGIPINIFLSHDPKNGLDLVKMNQDGKINLQKLQFLIENSFGRQLDMHHYLHRINKHVSGLIVAGDYDGCAILTWERPPSDPSRIVAYLDKFAVLKKLQGLPGLADVVFKAMLVNFKKELVWRSRKTNPVNKWYFDRSKANYCVPGTIWRVFYSGKKILTAKDLTDYKSICSSIHPSFKE